MPKRFSAASCKRHEALLTSTSLQHIWISDQLVADSFAHFTRSTRRHGSNIPGPLEAHRRASRRKNTSLAYVGAPSGAFDPTIVLGNTLPGGWWKPPAEEKKTTLDLEGKWLLSLLQPAKPLPTPVRDQLDLLDIEPQRVELKSFLWKHHTTETLCADISASHINLRQHPELCSDILDHILEAEWEGKEIANLLLTPSLNPPGSSNHFEITKRHFHLQGKQEEWSTIASALAESARLGILSVDGLEEIFRLMCDPGRYDPKLMDLRDCHELLEAVAESSIYGLQSLSTGFLHEFVSLLEKRGASLFKARILFILSRHQQALAEDLICKTCVDFLVSPLAKEEQLVNEFTALLSSLEPEILIPAVVRITEELVCRLQSTLGDRGLVDEQTLFRSISGEGQAESAQELGAEQNSLRETNRHSSTIGIWFSTIRALDYSLTDSKYIDHAAFIELFRFRKSTFATHQKFIMHVWTMMALRRIKDFPSDMSEENSLSRLTHEIFEKIPDAGTGDLLGKVVMTISQLPLSGKDALLDNLNLLPKRKRWTKSRVETLKKELEILLVRDFEKLGDENLYEHLRRNFPRALQEMCESLNHNLPLLERTSRQLIRNHKKAVHIILRILENNMELHLALNKSRRQSVQGYVPTNLGSLAKIDTTLAGVPVSSAVRFIHVVAVEFALSKAISAKDALRKTFWCFEFLNRYRAPITSIMARALWHAGVVRMDGQANVSRIEWLLQLVKEYDGADTARHLLLNTDLSRLGPKQKDILLNVLNDKTKRPSWETRRNILDNMKLREAGLGADFISMGHGE